MATLTTRLQATKPASTENVNVTLLNSNFDKFDAAVGSSVGTSASRPASAFQGRMFYTTDSTTLYVNTAASASAVASWAGITLTAPSDTGWVNITPASGTGTFQYRCYDKMVSVRASLSGITSIAAGTNGVILAAGGLPAAYRPAVTVYAVTNVTGSGAGLAVFGSDGGISQWAAASGGAVTVFRAHGFWFKE